MSELSPEKEAPLDSPEISSSPKRLDERIVELQEILEQLREQDQDPEGFSTWAGKALSLLEEANQHVEALNIDEAIDILTRIEELLVDFGVPSQPSAQPEQSPSPEPAPPALSVEPLEEDFPIPDPSLAEDETPEPKQEPEPAADLSPNEPTPEPPPSSPETLAPPKNMTFDELIRAVPDILDNSNNPEKPNNE